MKQLEAVIWDMDGLLVDTGYLHFELWQSTLAEYGILLSEECFRQMFGLNNESLLRRLLGERFSRELYEEITRRKEERFRLAIRGRLAPLPGALPLLHTLYEHHIPQAIGSSAPQANIDAIVAELGIAGYLQATVSAEAMPGKPDPAVFLAAATLLGARPARCIVVEDAQVGITAAHSAGMKCIAVATTHPAAALQAADLVVPGLDALEFSGLIGLLGAASFPG
jgi:HAD superfamily hydrolase (TIGR01509 family)